MRHAKAKYQLNRFTSWRRATLLSLAKNLLIHQRIHTTKTKARAVKPLIEKLINLGKTNTLFARRQAYRIIGDHKLVKLLFNDIGPRFNKRTGGYLKVMLSGQRRGDNAQLAVLELTEIVKKEVRKPVKKEKHLHPEAPEAEAQKGAEPQKPKPEVAVKEKPPMVKKPTKKFLGGLRNIFKKERDSL